MDASSTPRAPPGHPKGATLTHHNILDNAFLTAETCGITEADRICIQAVTLDAGYRPFEWKPHRGIGWKAAVAVDPSMIRELCAAGAPNANDGLIAACASLAHGDLDGARAVLAKIDPSSPEATSVAYLVWFLDHCWWPGQLGATPPADAAPAPANPPGDGSLMLTWAGRVLPQSLSLRSLASGALRAGEQQGSLMTDQLLLPQSGRWYQAAEQAADSVALLHAALVIAEVSRRAGRFDLAGQALADARAHSIGTAAAGAYWLCVGDALLTPRQSPETLGYDLEARNAGRSVGNDLERLAAEEFYRAAHDTFAQAGSERGQAAVNLRLAWLHRLSGHPGEAAKLSDAAAEKFAAAGDGAGRVLALTHHLLARLETGQVSATRPGPVSEIAGWATGPGSRSYAAGCAGIVHAEACGLRDSGEVERALAAFDFARRLQRATGDWLGEQLLVGDLGELYARLNSRGATIATAEEAFAETLRPHGGFDATGELDSVTWLRAVEMLATLNKQMVTDRDPDGLEDVQRRMIVMLSRAPGGPQSLRRPGQDLLVREADAQRRLAELGAARGGPFGGGREWADMQAEHVELAALSLSDMIATAEVMRHRARAEQAAIRGAVAEADREFAAALAAAESLGETLTLSVLAMWRRKDELLRRTRTFVTSAPEIDSELAATLWLNAEQYEQADKILRACPPEPALPGWRRDWDTFALRARAAFGSGRAADAAAFAGEGISRFERWFAAVPGDSFRISVADDVSVRRLYQVAAAAALAQGDDAAAFAAADRARSLTLGTAISETTSSAATPAVASAAFRAWRQARAEWNGAFDRRREAWRERDPTIHSDTAQQLVDAHARLDAAADELENVAPGRTHRRPEPLPAVSAADIARHLDPETLLVEYQLGDDQLMIWALTDSICRGFRSDVDSLALSGTIRRLHDAWQGIHRGPGAAADAVTVGDALLGPVSDLLEDYQRVLVVPSGAMHQLPFHALPFRGRSLGDDRAVSQLPAASLVPVLAGRPKPILDAPPLVVGDPDTDPARALARLPGARVEAVTVARTFGTRALVGLDADEPAIRTELANRHPIVHLATHGLLDEAAPDLSSLVLAGNEELTVAELVGSGLEVDLAVLSACDSGRGTLTLGGDVVGLARGLLTAGVRHSIVSLWPVDDRTACLTMAGFAEQLVAGDTIAAALSTAQRAVRDASEAERDERYRQLAAQADVPATAAGTRSSRDVAPPPGWEPPPEDHWSWWAPFVHIGY